MNAIRTIAGTELVASMRRRWSQLFTTAFVLVVLAMAASSGAVQDLGVVDGLPRTAIAVLPLVLALVPMMALLVGITGHAGEAGSEAFLFTQPVSRLEVLLGKWSGQVLAVCGTIAVGLGAGGVLVGVQTGAAGWETFTALILAAMVLGAAFLSIAALLAAAIPRRTTAIGAGLFAWFALVLLYDGVIIALAQSLAGSSGARVLFTSVFGNPVDLVRLLVLAFSETPHVLGAAGESWMRFLGGPSAAIGMSVTALALWTVVPLLAAWRALAVRDL
jgi:Cu-processing system permease protein